MANRLIHEKSPYLLQHAHQPVDWYPWGEEAFAKARSEKKPILLSVGYSTCHWCHVMAHESFDDPKIAERMNNLYISIKVDREERPDVDAIYMAAVQLVSGHGGWPMTVWLTPELKPFYAGTYFPPYDGMRGATVGFFTILERIREAYDQNPTAVAGSSERLVKALQDLLGNESNSKSTDLNKDKILESARALYQRRFDSENGGAQGQPKFPSSLPIRFLLRVGDTAAARLTLERMATRGLYDHVGGGFHRYSVDDRWEIPHFEKMLYDQALLLRAYTEAWLAEKSPLYEFVVRDLVQYLIREMRAPNGLYFSATDADSLNDKGHAEEGAFFVWTDAELVPWRAVLETFFEFQDTGNFEGRHHLVRKDNVAAPPEWPEIREKLYAIRSKRPAPHRDEKILSGWNGLLLAALAKAGWAFHEPEWIEAARTGLQTLRKNFWKLGRLLHGSSQEMQTGFLEDYAAVTDAALTFYEVTGEAFALEFAVGLQTVLDSRFAAPGGAYFRTSNEQEALIARELPLYDGAEPSGNSVTAINLIRLAVITGDESYRTRAEGLFSRAHGTLTRNPAALSEMLLALWLAHKSIKVIRLNGPVPEVVETALRESFRFDRFILRTVAPAFEGQICEGQSCRFVTKDPSQFAKELLAERLV